MVALENGKFVLRRRKTTEPSRLLLRPGVRRAALLASLLFACTQLLNRADLLRTSVSADDLLLLEVAEDANVRPAVAGIEGGGGLPANDAQSRQPSDEEDDINVSSTDDVLANGNGTSTIDSDVHPTQDPEGSLKDDGDDDTK